MTGSDHVWKERDGWDVCSRCGVAHSSRCIALTPCSSALPSAHRVGEQSPTSDEMEIDRLRLEVARLQRVVINSASSLDGLLEDAAKLGYQIHPRLVDALRWLARDLRAAPLVTPPSLDHGAPR